MVIFLMTSKTFLNHFEIRNCQNLVKKLKVKQLNPPMKQSNKIIIEEKNKLFHLKSVLRCCRHMQVIEWLKRIFLRDKHFLLSTFTSLDSRLTSICQEGNEKKLYVYARMIYDLFWCFPTFPDDKLEKFLMETVASFKTKNKSQTPPHSTFLILIVVRLNIENKYIIFLI